MNSLCPHAHLSYSAWRLGVFQSLAIACRARTSLRLKFLRSPARQSCSAESRNFHSSRRLERDRRARSGVQARDVATSYSRLGGAAREGRNTLKTREQNGHQSNTDEQDKYSESALNPQHKAPAAARKETKIPWSPFSTNGRDALKSMVHELKQRVKESAHLDLGDVPFEGSKRLSELLPWSPVAQRARAVRVHKRRPDSAEAKVLTSNPWARAIASPIRHCQATGVKIPRDLLVPWGLTHNPYDEQVYLMPRDLADVERLRTVQEERREELKHGISADARVRARGPLESPTAANHATHRLSRLWMLPLSSLMSELTSILMTAESDRERHSKKGAVARLFSERWHKSLAAAATKAKIDAKAKDNTQTTHTLPDAGTALSHAAPVDLSKVQWQTGIDSRLLNLLRMRVLAATEGMALQNNSTRAISRKRILAIPLPQMGADDTGNSEDLAQAFDSLTDAEEAQDEELAAPHNPEKLSDEQFFLDRISGGVFLHMGTKNDPSSITCFASPKLDPSIRSNTDSSSLLQDLPKHPLIPPTISILNTLRLPVFSARDLLGEESFTEFRRLAEEFEVLRPRPSPPLPSISSKPHTPDTQAESSEYLLLIKPFAPGAGALIQELWRLWRYKGGSLYSDWTFSAMSFSRPGSYSGDVMGYRRDPEVEVRDREA